MYYICSSSLQNRKTGKIIVGKLKLEVAWQKPTNLHHLSSLKSLDASLSSKFPSLGPLGENGYSDCLGMNGIQYRDNNNCNSRQGSKQQQLQKKVNKKPNDGTHCWQKWYGYRIAKWMQV